MIGLTHYLAVAAALFVIGIFGIFLNRKKHASVHRPRAAGGVDRRRFRLALHL
jgi:hypothetical protein